KILVKEIVNVGRYLTVTPTTTLENCDFLALPGSTLYISHMKYQDELYGTFDIVEPVLVDLIESDGVQRLKLILQHGISALVDMTPPVTRFEHSVGAMLICRKLGATVKEQIAALIHDVSHTAFSHVMDHVFDSAESQSYHDQVKEEFVSNTNIPQILANHGYKWRPFLLEENYPILEQPSPRICADRLDYTLRDGLAFDFIGRDGIKLVMDSLIVCDGRPMFNNLEAANQFSRVMIACDDFSWANFNEVGLYEMTSQTIKRAFVVGAITQDDVWGTDAAVWQKIRQFDDAELQRLRKTVTKNIQFEWNAEEPDFVLTTKIRTVDPDVNLNGQVKLLSEWDADFKAHRESYLERKKGPWPMKLVSKMSTELM
ncbi:MAG: HD domain-containing protein, partial [Chloroflexota bacterium]